MKSVWYGLIFLFNSCQLALAQPLTNDANTLLLLNFDNTVNGVGGEVPLSSQNIVYNTGRFGQALQCNGSTFIKFDTTGNLNRHQGTIEFWIKPENFTGAGYLLDYNYVNGILLEIGYFTGIGINKNPDVFVYVPADAWFPNTWYHLAFTWGNGDLKMYLNGKLKSSKTYTPPLSTIPLNQFAVGSPSFGSGGFKGLVDEFRISKTPRSEYEICNSYLQGNGSFTSVQSSVSSINMFTGWEIYLNSPNSYQCPVITASQGTNTFVVNAACISWSVSDPTILSFNPITYSVKAKAVGTANLIATLGTTVIQIPVTVTRLIATGEPDLSVKYIKRLPEINYVENSTNPTVEGWPNVGQSIKWRAYVKNWAPNSYNNVSYIWKKNNNIVKTGVISFAPDSEVYVDLDETWAFQRDSIEFVIDNSNSFSEFNEANNSLQVYTNAISANIYVEQSLYDYFHLNQYKLGVQTNSFDDWLQKLHVKRWNQMLKDAVFPSDVPNGVLDRVRIDSIVIVPDNALPLNGGGPTNNPNVLDKTVDMQWGLPWDSDYQTFFSNQTAVSDGNPFFFHAGLFHELGHARYLIDTYGMNVTTPQVKINEGNIPIAGSSLMPIISFDVVYYNKNTDGLMSGTYTKLALYDAMCLNRIAYRRAICGNMNAPCNMGIFINDLPTNNFFTLRDQDNNLLDNACVEIYRAAPQVQVDFYGKTFDDIPDLLFTTDVNGKVNVGRNPFSSTPIVHTYGNSSMNLILRVEKNGKVGYKIIEAADFNIEYWRGNTSSANYQINVNMLPCANFAGATCNCTLTSVADLRSLIQLKLFPNPAKDQLFFAKQPVQCNYRVISITGQVMFSGNGFINNINTRSLQSGIYLLEIKEKEKVSIGKFYKQ